MRILITRPQPQSARTAAALRAAGHAVTEAPIFTLANVADADFGPGPWSAVVMTSANAARALAAHPRRMEIIQLPAFVVGERSAEAARDAGFANVESAGGDVRDLVRHLAAGTPLPRRILYLAGADRAADLASLLNASGCEVTTAVIYRAIAAQKLPAAASTLLKSDGIDAVLHFSRRGAETLLALAAEGSCLVNVLKCKNFCLSQQVADAVDRAGVTHTFVADRPDEASLLDLVGKA